MKYTNVTLSELSSIGTKQLLACGHSIPASHPFCEIQMLAARLQQLPAAYGTPGKCNCRAGSVQLQPALSLGRAGGHFGSSHTQAQGLAIAGPLLHGRQRFGDASLPSRLSSIRSSLSSSMDTSTTSSSGRTAVDYFATDRRPVVLFDGVCNFCNANVNFLLDWDKQGALRLAALQSEAGKKLLARAGRAPDDLSSIVLVEPDAIYLRSDAVLRIARKLSMPLPLLHTFGWPVPKVIRDTLYNQVANNRYAILGRRDVCRLSDKRFEDRFVSD